MKKQHQITVLRITLTAMFLALNIAFSSFSIPVPGGHFYLNDIVICIASLLLGPFEAFMVGGIGSFLGDLFFYPTPMFVSLVTRGLQAVAISLFSHYVLKKHPLVSGILAVSIGAVIQIVGYSIGRAFIYSTPEYAIAKLPYQALMAVGGAVIAIVVLYPLKLKKYYDQFTRNKE